MIFCDNPVFIIASERSGTNLLRKRLTDNQSYYLGPSPAHFLKHLYYQEPYYGDLLVDENFVKFIRQAIELCTVHFSPWDINWSTKDIVEDYGKNPRNSIFVMHYFMSRYAIENGYKSYVCKDNYLYEFALDIAESIPSSKFIYLYRDPRDFVASQMKRPGSTKSPIKFSRLWSYEQVKSIKVSSLLMNRGRCMKLSYEDFISDDLFWVGRIFDYLGVELGDKGSYSDKDIEKVHEWKNLDKPTMSGNKGKYLTELSVVEIKQVEAICHICMEYLGYDRQYKDIIDINKYSRFIDNIKSLIKRKFFSEKRPSGSCYKKRTQIINKIKVNYRNDR
jgi:hypothetical protein